jgi:hypothetical protein
MKVRTMELMLRSTHEKYGPQMTQMGADIQKRKRLVFNLRESVSSADK